jgi:predicted GNAT family N-acyltransferase
MIEEILNNKFSDYLIGLDIYEDGKSIKLTRIVIKDEFRGSGVGSDIMSDLINYADNNKKIITLTPSSDFGGNKNRLIQFYKRFGFKPNKGVHKSYEYMDAMIRWPKINEGSSTKTLIKDLLRESLINFR